MKVALIQAPGVLFDAVLAVQRLEEWVAKASAKHPDLVLFPEAFIGGYPRGLSFGTVVGHRNEQGRGQWLDYWKGAIEVPGKEVDAIGQVAAKYEIHLVLGAVERDPSGSTLYCSLLFWGPDGKLLHRHRKLKPTASERLIWGEGDGSDLQVLDTPLGRLGGLICWENYMPLARMALYQQQIQIYLAPTADQRDSWQASMRHIACEGRCFVLSCNQYVEKALYPEAYQTEIKDMPEVMCRGGSVVVDPLGNVLAGPLWDQEGIVYADLNLELVAKGKFDFDVVGHYARRDVFRFEWLKAD